jgi:hypothetical protein
LLAFALLNSTLPETGMILEYGRFDLNYNLLFSDYLCQNSHGFGQLLLEGQFLVLILPLAKITALVEQFFSHLSGHIPPYYGNFAFIGQLTGKNKPPAGFQ